MSEKNTKSFKKANPQAGGQGYRTSDFFKKKTFSPGGKQSLNVKYNPATFKTQHKG